MEIGSTPDWFHLGDEELVWESRPHPIEMGLGVPAGVVLALVGLALTWWAITDEGTIATVVGVLIMVGGAGYAFVRYLFWTNTRYVITTGELYKKRGVVSRDVTQFRLDRIQNTSLEQSAVGRLLGYGDLTVYTAGSGDPELTFERLPRPEQASSLLSDQLDRVSSGPNTNRSTYP